MTANPLHPGTGQPVARAAGGRRAFSLVELLVVVSIILVLMSMLGAAVAAARGSQKRQATQALIAKLDAIIQQQFATYSSRSVPANVLSGTSKSAARAAYLRRLASAEMPDNWQDVQLIAEDAKRIDSGAVGLLFSGTTMTAPQRAYASIYTTSTAAGRTPTPDNADAECLFMIVMQGGIADCLECRELTSSEKGDTDGDGAFEFLDAWGSPIRYVLWPAGFELPPGTGRFFSTTAPFTAEAPQFAKGGTMRPLIFSHGADGRGTTVINDSANLGRGSDCGNPNPSNPGLEVVKTFGGLSGTADARGDNVTNFDAEAAK